jgi:Carboxypeptidase regulatory-like domain
MKREDARGTARAVFVNGAGLMLIILTCGCETRPPTEQTCAINGRVVSAERNTPIAGARVMVTMPRPALGSSDPFGQVYTGVTDADGRYSIIGIPAWADTPLELIAKAKGYQTPWGRDRIDEPTSKIILRAGPMEVAELKLKKGQTSSFSGTVIDDLGRPLKNVKVHSGRLLDNSDERGGFEILDEGIGADSLTTIAFTHPDYISTWIDDISQTPLAEREQMRIVLKAGTKIEGVLLDPLGKPMPSTLVRIKTLDSKSPPYKGAMTDDSGRFSIKGIVPQAYRLYATTPTAFGAVVVDITKNNDNVALRLVTAYTGRSRTLQFLGMTLAEADEALAAHWSLREGSVIVIEPGTKIDRSGPFAYKMQAWSRIAGVEINGNQYGEVTSFLDLVAAIINASARQLQDDMEQVNVRIVTTFPAPRGDMTLSFMLKLSMSDIEEARTLMNKLQLEL